MSSAGFTEGRTASSAQHTVPNVSAVHSNVKVTDVETGETHSHVGPIPTSTVSARAVHNGPGLVGAILATVAVLNSFGRPQRCNASLETKDECLISQHYKSLFMNEQTNKTVCTNMCAEVNILEKHPIYFILLRSF